MIRSHFFLSSIPFGSQRAGEPVHISMQCRVEKGNTGGCKWKLSSTSAGLLGLLDAFRMQLPALLPSFSPLSLIGDGDFSVQVFYPWTLWLLSCFTPSLPKSFPPPSFFTQPPDLIMHHLCPPSLSPPGQGHIPRSPSLLVRMSALPAFTGQDSLVHGGHHP